MRETVSVSHKIRLRDAARTFVLRAGDGIPLIFIHGVGMNHSVWEPQIREFEKSHSVVAYDLLGHGQSTLPPEDPRLEDFVAQLISVIDVLELPQAHLVGHSMGALISLDAALTYPDRFLSVTAMNAVYCRPAALKQAVADRAEGLRTQGQRAGVDGTIARWFGSMAPDQLDDRALQVKTLLESVDPEGYARTYRVFAAADTVHANRLHSIEMPALFLTGELDSNSTPAMSAAMAAEVSNGRVEVLGGERHMMPVVSAGKVNNILKDFLSSADNDRS